VPGALQSLRRALELDPENARAHLLLGYIHLEREDYPESERHLRSGIQLLATRPDMGSVLAEARNVLGVALIHQERYADAIEALVASSSDPMNMAPWYAWGNLGWAYYEQEAHDDSIAALERAVDIQPQFCLGFYLMGQTLFALERFEEAEEALTHSLEAHERCADANQRAFALRGETRARLGHREDAMRDFERCVQMGARTESGRTCERFLESVQ
jgi:tetratricopeptide (TPR) repeat protein